MDNEKDSDENDEFILEILSNLKLFLLVKIFSSLDLWKNGLNSKIRNN